MILYDGYINLWRKSLEGGLLKNHKAWAFWTWCLMKASYKIHKQIIGFQEIELMPGQFIFGRKKASIELSMSERSIRTCLNFLINSKNLTIKTTNKFSIITICNWNSYQDIKSITDQQPTNNRPTTDQQLTTNNKGNKGNKGNKEKKVNKEKKRLFGTSVFLTDEEYQKLETKFGKLITDDWIERMNLYAGQKPEKFKEYASHYMTILNWAKMKEDRKGGNNGQKSTGRSNEKYTKRGGHAPTRDLGDIFREQDRIVAEKQAADKHLE